MLHHPEVRRLLQLRTVLTLALTPMPMIGLAAQRIDVQPKPAQGCKGAPSVDSTVYDLEETTPGPQLRSFMWLIYPVALREAGINGEATLAYVVRTDGTVDSSSVTVMAATDSAFIAPSRATVIGSRFWPGCRAGVPVRVQVTQVLRFEAKNYSPQGLLLPPKPRPTSS